MAHCVAGGPPDKSRSSRSQLAKKARPRARGEEVSTGQPLAAVLAGSAPPSGSRELGMSVVEAEVPSSQPPMRSAEKTTPAQKPGIDAGWKLQPPLLKTQQPKRKPWLCPPYLPPAAGAICLDLSTPARRVPAPEARPGRGRRYLVYPRHRSEERSRGPRHCATRSPFLRSSVRPPLLRFRNRKEKRKKRRDSLRRNLIV